MTPDTQNQYRSDGENNPLFLHCENFCRWLLGTTVKFPRRLRYTFTNRIDNLALDMLEYLSEAWFIKDAPAKLTMLETVNRRNTRLRILLRQAYYHKVLSPRRFTFAMEQIEISGKMLGGWIKQVSGHKEKQA